MRRSAARMPKSFFLAFWLFGFGCRHPVQAVPSGEAAGRVAGIKRSEIYVVGRKREDPLPHVAAIRVP
jgi:hypothetical protein